MGNDNIKTILIGREQGKSRLMIALINKGNIKTTAIGLEGSVPGSVSRCRPQEGVAHAKIEINNRGDMTLFNMKPQNVTCIDGVEVMTKRLDVHARTIELGPEHFRVDLYNLLNDVEILENDGKRIVGVPYNEKTDPKAFEISHLEKVWNDYHNRNIEMRKRQKKLGLLGSASLIFSLGGGALTVIMGSAMDNIIPIFTVIGFIVCITSFYLRGKDNSIEATEKATEEFQDNYICPNPECGKFLGNYSYKLMKKQYSMSCPYCKCKFKEGYFMD